MRQRPPSLARPHAPTVLVVAHLCVLIVLSACPRSSAADQQTPGASPADDAPPLPVVRDDSTSLLFSFVDANGRVLTVPSASAVPEPVRARVLVVDLDKTPEQRQAHRYAFFADLSASQADGSYSVVAVSRYDAARAGAAAPALPPPDGSVVIYSAAWCGYCKKEKAWLKEHGVAFIERDVDNTPGAAAELAAKLKSAGVVGGGIPVTDWQGSIVVGFDVPALSRLLAAGPAAH